MPTSTAEKGSRQYKKWTEEEVAKFEHALEIYGKASNNKWVQVSKFMETRSAR